MASDASRRRVGCQRRPSGARHSGKILAEAQSVLTAPDKSAHDRYLDLYQLMRERSKTFDGPFNGMSRSSAHFSILMMHGLGLPTGAKLRRLSPETLQRIEMYRPIPEQLPHPPHRRTRKYRDVSGSPGSTRISRLPEAGMRPEPMVVQSRRLPDCSRA